MGENMGVVANRVLPWRKKWVLGNWKMNGSLARVSDFFASGRKASQSAGAAAPEAEIAVGLAVPHPYLAAASVGAASCGESFVLPQGRRCPFALGAQDLSHFSGVGAYTGETSAEMLADLGCAFALVGHSERREYFRESDEMLALKLANAEAAGLTAVFCVGEDWALRAEGKALETIAAQLGPVEASCAKRVVVAYEPVWAIGSGRTATPEEIGQVHEFIHKRLRDSLPGRECKALYGGSVKPDNARRIAEIAGVDGVLVGGASLERESFAALAGEVLLAA